jgi:hypothetical protein
VANARDDLVIGCFRAGAIDDEELSRLVADAWAEAIVDPVDAAEIASILDIAKEKLRIFPPPIVVEVRSGGITGAEIALVFAGAFAGAYARLRSNSLGRFGTRRSLAVYDRLKPKHWARRCRGKKSHIKGAKGASCP